MEKKFGVKKEMDQKFKPKFIKKKNLKEMVLVTSKNHRNKTLKTLIKKLGFKKVIIYGKYWM